MEEEKKLIELLEYICCPKCKGDLDLKKEKEFYYVCKNCKSKYPIKEGIPILLDEEDYKQFI